MAKAYVTSIDWMGEVWKFDVESIDSEKVVLHDGSVHCCHCGNHDFWKTEEEARAAVRFALDYAERKLKAIIEIAQTERNIIMDKNITVTKKN